MAVLLLILRLLDEVVFNLFLTILANIGSDQAGYGVLKPPSLLSRFKLNDNVISKLLLVMTHFV